MSEQGEVWRGEFGTSYTDRNALTLEEVAATYISRYNTTPPKLKKKFVGNIRRSAKILEVGSNIGNQLLWLRAMGFENLYGIEIQTYAAKISKTKNLNIIIGSAFDLPFEDDSFDLIFTDGLLIHISPEDINRVLQEIYRCSNKYIWGFEYYADKYVELLYRGRCNLMWKANFAKLYLSLFPGLRLIKKKYLKYIKNNSVDVMFLLEKANEYLGTTISARTK